MPGDKFIIGPDEVVFASKTQNDVYDRFQILGDGRHTMGDGTAAPAVFFTPVATATAYTQTYSTAERTIAALTATALTHSAVGGTANGTLVDCTASYSEAAVEENFKELATAFNLLLADHTDLLQAFTALIDDLQARKIVG